ncbi:MAG: hypothetical protein IJC02_14300 [Lachnospiraceae bacterium]|nr:hypothetical protein [Lachnospiraceae bacterium]
MFEPLDHLFDFNHDGELDGMERVAEFAFADSFFHEDEDEEIMTDLELAGLEPEELEYMDEHERKELLEDAGLDPDDYDF